MIPVEPRPEYADFDARVRRPGQRFLESNPSPSSRDFEEHEYWYFARPELHRAYERCAYSSQRIMGNGGTVDHYLPKGCYPQFAYEWTNYRLARPKLNSRKGRSVAVVDPFVVQEGWFVLECPNCLICVGDELEESTALQVRSTIDVLKLNSLDLVDERSDALVDVARGNTTLSHLEWYYPFLAHEVRRQGIEEELATLFAL